MLRTTSGTSFGQYKDDTFVELYPRSVDWTFRAFSVVSEVLREV